MIYSYLPFALTIRTFTNEGRYLDTESVTWRLPNVRFNGDPCPEESAVIENYHSDNHGIENYAVITGMELARPILILPEVQK